MKKITTILNNATWIKFSIVGCSNAAIGFFAFYIFYNLVTNEKIFISQCLSYATGIIWSYYLNHKWTFSGKGGLSTRLPAFAMLQVTLLLTSAYLLSLAEQNINIHINILWIIIMLIFTIINFIASKHLVFRYEAS